MPLTVGPGSISVAITIGANFPSTIQPYLADAAAAVIGALVVCIATYACYRYAEAIARLLGAGGTAVVLRLSAFIMLCIGVQVMVNGGDALLMQPEFAPRAPGVLRRSTPQDTAPPSPDSPAGPATETARRPAGTSGPAAPEAPGAPGDGGHAQDPFDPAVFNRRHVQRAK